MLLNDIGRLSVFVYLVWIHKHYFLDYKLDKKYCHVAKKQLLVRPSLGLQIKNQTQERHNCLTYRKSPGDGHFRVRNELQNEVSHRFESRWETKKEQQACVFKKNVKGTKKWYICEFAETSMTTLKRICRKFDDNFQKYAKRLNCHYGFVGKSRGLNMRRFSFLKRAWLRWLGPQINARKTKKPTTFAPKTRQNHKTMTLSNTPLRTVEKTINPMLLPENTGTIYVWLIKFLSQVNLNPCIFEGKLTIASCHKGNNKVFIVCLCSICWVRYWWNEQQVNNSANVLPTTCKFIEMLPSKCY